MKTNELLAILSDKPTSVDRLGFQDYSNTLAGITNEIQTPTTIGVFGDWGSGKTSLMRMVDEQLKQREITTIWFNAWKYNKEDALWRALILAILKGVGAKKTLVDDVIIKLYSAIATEKLGKVEVDWLEISKVLLKGVALLTLPFLWIPGFASLLGEWGIFDQIAKAFTRKTIQQNQERISSIEQFEQLYQEIIAKYTKQGQRVVIFIDDLDRCLPGKALEVLEALKSFMDVEGCVYIVSCDTRLIKQGLLEKYGDKSGVGIEDYLEKIIPVSFNIPPINVQDAENFIKNLGWISEFDSLCHLIAETIDRNPRKLKRFLSNLEVKRQIAETRDLQIKTDVMVKMSCISSAWPLFWNDVLDDPSLFDKLQQCALNEEAAKSIGKNQKLKLLFETEPQLVDVLRQLPHISESDLNQNIFLAKTTISKVVSTQEAKESKFKDYDIGELLDVLSRKGEYLITQLPSSIEDIFLIELERDIVVLYQKLDAELISGSRQINKKTVEDLMRIIDAEILPSVSEWSHYVKAQPESPRPRELFVSIKSVGLKLRDFVKISKNS